MKKIINKILEDYSDLHIVTIFATGSQLFRDNPHDYDIEVVVNNYSKKYTRTRINLDGRTYDVSFKDENFLLDNLKFPPIRYGEIYGSLPLYNYFYNINEVLYGINNYKWDMMNNKDKYISYIREAYRVTLGKMHNKSFITKFWVHYYIILKMYDNSSTDITDEMLLDIDTLYNRPKETKSIIDWVEFKLDLTEGVSIIPIPMPT